MRQWKTQVRITLNLNRITFGNVTACNLDFYRRSAVKGFIPLEKYEGREKLLMLMDFWKLQGLRKLCPLSLLSYAVLSITPAIKISSLAPPRLPRPSQPALWLLHFLSCFVLSPRPRLAQFSALLPLSVCCFSSTRSRLGARAVNSGFKVFYSLPRKCSPGVKVPKTEPVCRLHVDAHCRTRCVSLRNKGESKPLEINTN